jgi:peroxiredoxin
MRPDIRPGGIFPDYALPDHTGTVRTLSELQGRDPLILTLARGNYCPKEHQQHLELAAARSLGRRRLLEVSRLGPAVPSLSTDFLRALVTGSVAAARWTG